MALAPSEIDALTRLYKAFVKQIASDLKSGCSCSPWKPDMCGLCSAETWLEDENSDGPFSLTGVAGWLGLNPLALQKKLRDGLSKEPSEHPRT